MRYSNSVWPLVVVTICNLVIAAIAFAAGLAPAAVWTLMLAAVVSQAVATRQFVRYGAGFRFAEGAPDQSSLDAWRKQQDVMQRERAEFEELRSKTVAGFQELSQRLGERERSLAERLVQYQEFMNYPTAAEASVTSTAQALKLTENDHRVSLLLEAEAERVYEKIRQNGYWVSGTLDTEAVRKELLDLVHRIARIYAPGSQHPLLETSFEQLARSASRICLHVLVLLEQLPLGVQKSNFRSLYRYFQNATAGYGAYKKAAPWLTYLSRGIYAGRIAAATNPITLGAWWLASEVGKRGAARFVENVVDKQAIAVLHDLVTVVGVEVACIYGPGFRQRDAAWIHGTELVELISRFPVSRDSLGEGLRQVTALPLSNEYDRIYLYRCLAAHQPSGMRLPDPAVLSREQRERIAAALEHFFAHHIHGATADLTRKWQQDFEDRFDLKLTLKGSVSFESQDQQAAAALRAVSGFLSQCCGWHAQQVRSHLQTCPLLGMVSEEVRSTVIRDAGEWKPESQFHPPDIEPASALTDAFLLELAKIAVASRMENHAIEDLVLETGAYYRRPASEIRRLIDDQLKATLIRLTAGRAIQSEVDGRTVRCILAHRKEEEVVAFVYPDIATVAAATSGNEDGSASPADRNDSPQVLSGASLVGFRTRDGAVQRTLLLLPENVPDSIWQASGKLKVHREKRILIDDLIIADGTWLGAWSDGGSQRLVLVSGSLRGGRFRNYFQPLLEFAQDPI